METWTRVKWTEAAQIAELLEGRIDLGGRGAESPKTFFDALTADGRLRDAAFFLGQALPRYETVAWAIQTVADIAAPQAPAPRDREALDVATAWLRDPTNEHLRRTAFEAAQRAAPDSPARLAALAVFFSGGSISPADCPPVPAPREAAGRLAAGAVVMAAIKSGDQPGALTRALASGDRIAAQGLDNPAA